MTVPDSDFALELFFSDVVEELWTELDVDVAGDGINTSSPLTALSLVSIWLNLFVKVM